MKRCCDPVNGFESIIEQIIENVSKLCNSDAIIIDVSRLLDNSNEIDLLVNISHTSKFI